MICKGGFSKIHNLKEFKIHNRVYIDDGALDGCGIKQFIKNTILEMIDFKE